MGFALLGLFALNTEGIQGSVLVMVNHGITTGLLFILLGYLYTRRHTYEIAALRGIAKAAPIFAGVFTVAMLASIGVPGLNGFVGEFLALLGTFIAHRWWAVIAAAGVIFAALYLLWAYQRAFHGPAEGPNASFPEITVREGALLSVFVAAALVAGIYPKPMIDRVEPSVAALVERVRDAAQDGEVAP